MADLFFRCPQCDGHLVVDDRGAGLQLPCPFCSTSVEIPAKSQANSPGKAASNSVEGMSGSMATPSSPDPGKTTSHERRRLAAMMSAEEEGTINERGGRGGLPSGRNQSLRTADDIRKAPAEDAPTSDLDSQFQELIRKEIVRLQAGETSATATPSPAPEPAAVPARRKPLPPLAQHAEVVASDAPDVPITPPAAEAQPDRITRSRPDTVGAALPPLVTLDSMELDSEVAKNWGNQAVVKTGQLNWLAIVVILSLLIVGAYFGFHGYQEWSNAKDEQPAEAELQPINGTEASPSASPEAQPVISALRDFHDAISAEAKSVFVRDRHSVLPLMQDHYALVDVESRLIDQESLRFDKRLIGKKFFHTVSGEYAETLRPFFADFEQTASGKYLLDWRSWVGQSEMSLEAFAEAGLTDSRTFRVWVEVRDYYRYDFADAAKYRSYLIKDKNEKIRLFGYAENGTPDWENLRSLFRELKKQGKKQRARLMLSLRFPPDGDKRRGQVLITRLVNDSWIEPSSE